MDNVQIVYFPTRNPRNCSRTLPKRSGLTQVFRNCLHYLFSQENSLIYDFRVYTLFRTANLSLLVRTESPFAPLTLTQTRLTAFTVNASGVGRFGVGCSTGGI